MRFLTAKQPFLGIALVAICSAAHGQNAQTITYKIPEAGIQIDLPAGWEASKDANGNHLIMKKDGDSYVVLSMSVIPREPSMTIDVVYALFSEGVLKTAKRDWKGFKAGEIMKDTQNGMAVRAQKIDGTIADEGGELEGLVIVIDASKPFGIFAQRTKKLSDALAKESSDILGSIKRIQ
jgi:hypothetical protein